MQEKEKITPLTIVYLSDEPQRIENAKFTIRRMLGNEPVRITYRSYDSRTFDGIETAETIYRFIDLSDKMKNYDLSNLKADQAIIDYREPMIDIAKKLLKDSCVPEEMQIIDDRDLGITTIPPWMI